MMMKKNIIIYALVVIFLVLQSAAILNENWFMAKTDDGDKAKVGLIDICVGNNCECTRTLLERREDGKNVHKALLYMYFLPYIFAITAVMAKNKKVAMALMVLSLAVTISILAMSSKVMDEINKATGVKFKFGDSYYLYLGSMVANLLAIIAMFY
jgi:hypothetical protein